VVDIPLFIHRTLSVGRPRVCACDDGGAVVAAGIDVGEACAHLFSPDLIRFDSVGMVRVRVEGRKAFCLFPFSISFFCDVEAPCVPSWGVFMRLSSFSGQGGGRRERRGVL
jgi:hypothetical protein